MRRSMSATKNGSNACSQKCLRLAREIILKRLDPRLNHRWGNLYILRKSAGLSCRIMRHLNCSLKYIIANIFRTAWTLCNKFQNFKERRIICIHSLFEIISNLIWLIRAVIYKIMIQIDPCIIVYIIPNGDIAASFNSIKIGMCVYGLVDHLPNARSRFPRHLF